MTFKDGSTTLGTGTLSGGQTTFSTASLGTLLNAGTHSITAVYCGNSRRTATRRSTFSTAAPLHPSTQVIQKAHLAVTANNASRAYGAANPAFSATLSGFVGGQMLASSGVTGTAACASTANATTNAGVYGPETAQAYHLRAAVR